MTGLFMILLIVFLVAGLPVAQAIGLSSLIGQAQTTGVQLTTLGGRIFGAVNKESMICIPMFLFAGALMNSGGVTKRLFGFANKLVGWFPGGLAHVNIVASLIFAGMSGSSLADLGGLGAMEMHAMREEGFPEEVTIAVTGCSSLLGPMIPPSVVLIMYGVLSGASIGALFIAGVLPGVIMALFMMAFVVVLDKKYHFPRHPVTPPKELLKSFLEAIPSLMTVVIILVGIYTGVFTTNEAGSIAALWALFLAVVVYREVGFKDIPRITKGVMEHIGSVTLIMGFAAIFSSVLVRSMLPQKIAAWLTTVITSRAGIMLALVIFLLICGCFMETNASMAILLPIFIPILQQHQISLVQFGIIFELAFGIGGMTPPFGLLIFMMQQISGMNSGRIIKAYMPWIILMILCLLVIAYVPAISLWLPKMAGFSI